VRGTGRKTARNAGRSGKRRRCRGCDPTPRGPPRRRGGRATATATRMRRWQRAARPSPTEGRGRGGCRRRPHSRAAPHHSVSKAAREKGQQRGCWAGPPTGLALVTTRQTIRVGRTGRHDGAPTNLTDLCVHGPNVASPTKRMEWAVAVSLSAVDSTRPAGPTTSHQTGITRSTPPHVRGWACGGPGTGSRGR